MRVFISGTTRTLYQFRSYLTAAEKNYCVFYFADDPNNEISDELLGYIYERMAIVGNIFCLFEDAYFDRQYTLYEFDLIQQYFLSKSSGAALDRWLDKQCNASRVETISVTGASTWKQAAQQFRQKFFR
jgi:hypothetical protein